MEDCLLQRSERRFHKMAMGGTRVHYGASPSCFSAKVAGGTHSCPGRGRSVGHSSRMSTLPGSSRWGTLSIPVVLYLRKSAISLKKRELLLRSALGVRQYENFGITSCDTMDRAAGPAHDARGAENVAVGERATAETEGDLVLVAKSGCFISEEADRLHDSTRTCADTCCWTTVGVWGLSSSPNLAAIGRKMNVENYVGSKSGSRCLGGEI